MRQSDEHLVHFRDVGSCAETTERSPGATEVHLAAGDVIALVVALAGSILPARGGEAAVRQTIPDEQAGPPFYARIEATPIKTHTWAAIPFYRDPTCVLDNINLLSFFDIPGALSCALTVEGFVTWEKFLEELRRPNSTRWDSHRWSPLTEFASPGTRPLAF